MAAGMLFSVGLLKQLSLEDMEACIKSQWNAGKVIHIFNSVFMAFSQTQAPLGLNKGAVCDGTQVEKAKDAMLRVYLFFHHMSDRLFPITEAEDFLTVCLWEV